MSSQTSDLSVTDSMISEQNRFASFKHWPFDRSKCNCTSKKMAEAGFYHCPTATEPDLVRCFVCFRELDGWEPNDEPWSEHEKHTLKKDRKCAFMDCKKPEAELTIEQLLQILKSRSISQAKTLCEQRLDLLESKAEELKDRLKSC